MPFGSYLVEMRKVSNLVNKIINGVIHPPLRRLNPCFNCIELQRVNMEPSYEAFLQECIRETLEIFPLEERLKGIPPKEVLEQFSVEDRLKGLPPEVLEKQLAKLRQKSP